VRKHREQRLRLGDFHHCSSFSDKYTDNNKGAEPPKISAAADSINYISLGRTLPLDKKNGLTLRQAK
jgi:hypothetical protein